ncbi:leucine zipper domain-containing protein [Kribbella sp. VKM Ac-2568]|uniref:leucine zipper domain-containing protein n=1 Tax=Kribbella sp. VKM Ac-2568 TaxID=2512219 RepID=UPI0018EE9072
MHRAWGYKLKARYEAEGEAAFEPRSRRPKTSPRATPVETVELVLALRKQLDEAGWTPVRTRSVGTCNTTTRSRCRGRRSTGSSPAPAPWLRTRASGRGRRTCGSPGAAERVLVVRLHPTTASPARTAHPAPMWSSLLGWTTTPATPRRSPPTGGSPARSCSPRSSVPKVSIDSAWFIGAGGVAGDGHDLAEGAVRETDDAVGTAWGPRSQVNTWGATAGWSGIASTWCRAHAGWIGDGLGDPDEPVRLGVSRTVGRAATGRQPPQVRGQRGRPAALGSAVVGIRAAA